MRKNRIHHGLALASATTLISMSCAALAGAAVADPEPGHQDHGKHLGQVKHEHHHSGHQEQGHGQGGQQHGPKAVQPNNGHAHAHGHTQAPGQEDGQEDGQNDGQEDGQNDGQEDGQNDGQEDGDAHGNGDPLGNNGTVKIAGPGDAVGHPSNDPHPGCTVDVEWFGFDQGQDVVSTVDFAVQAPTSDVTIGGTSPAQVFVGGDPAGGGTDLDGRRAYTLTFSGGEPHPQQGYHVKLTVATPRSLGNDTKTKVFWVARCDDGATPAAHGASSHHATTGDSGERGVEAAAVAVPSAGEETGTTGGTTRGTTAVPTSVDAGEDAPVLPGWARSRWPLAAVVGGLALTVAGLLRRDRARG